MSGEGRRAAPRAACASWAPCADGDRNGLAIDAALTLATGTAERKAALAMLDRKRTSGRRITLGAHKAYDVTGFVGDLRRRNVPPHITANGAVSKLG
jgi:hypothetical protein